jgi:Ni/Fe-hydrogenase 1 B-type cytochrome subunit
MIFTGFGLYADTATWWLPKMFSWVPSFLGGDFITRTIHHITMWLIILIVMLHIYLVLYHDWLEGRGETSSMISGYKFVRGERVDKKKK